MTDNTIRKLRNRRPPPYLLGDVNKLLSKSSDPELFGYARSNYPKDFVSPAQQLNSLAKVLSKFINSTNKKFLDKVNENQSKEASLPKNRTHPIQQEIKKTNRTNEGTKKKQNQKYDNKDISQKIDRDATKIKEPETLNAMVSKQKQKIQDGNRKEIQASKNTKSGGKIESLSNGVYANKMQELKQQHGGSMGNPGKIQLDAATKAIQQQQQLLKYNPSLREKLQISNNSVSRNHQDEKYFKRSSYHTAIAYHIHLINLKESGKDLQAPLTLDPTYPARKLRGEYDSDNQRNHH